MGFNVLILEDNESDARLMQQYLQRSDESFDKITYVQSKEAYEEALQTFEADLILSDYRLINFNGLEAIKLKNRYCDKVPLIIISATIGEEKAVELIKAGAVDFLLKSHARQRLPQMAMRAIRESKEKWKRQQAESALQESMHRYQTLFNSSLDGILIGIPSKEGNIIDANQALCNMLGYTRKEIKQLKRKDLFKLDSISLDKLVHKREKTKRGKFIGELNLKHKSGDIIPVEVTSRIIRLENGEERTYSIIRDIRERKQTEQELRREQEIQELQKDIAQIVNWNTGFRESLKQCIHRISDFLTWPVGHVYFRNRSNGTSRFESLELWHLPESEKDKRFVSHSMDTTFQMGEGLVGTAAATKELMIVHPASHESEYLRADSATEAELKTGLLLPVAVDGEVEVVLEFYAKNEKELDPKIKNALKSISNQIGRLVERRRHLQALEEEKERYRLMAQNSTDMIARHTPEGQYLYVSPASNQIMGYHPEELIGNTLYDYFHPRDLEKIQKSHKTIFKNPDIYTISYRIKQKGGGWRWVETTCKTLKNPDTGKVKEIQTATRDISNRKEYEQDLKRQNKLNETIINSLPELFFILSEDKKIQRINVQFSGTLGYSGEEIIGKKPTTFIAKQDRELAFSSLETAFREGSVEVEINLQAKDGSLLPYVLSGTVNELDGEKYFLGAGINIADRVEAERELKKEKEFIDKAINSLPGLFYVLDDKNNYMRINENFVTDLGYSREEIDQMQPLDFYQKKDHDKLEKAINKAFTEGEASLVSQIKTKKGTLPWYYLTGTHITQEGKNFILGTGINITERKKLEDLLQQAHQLARIGAWEVDLVNNEVNWTPVTKKIHEVPLDYEPDLETALDFYKKGKSRDTIELAVREAIQNGTSFDKELQIVTAKGNERWIRTIGKAEFREGECVRLYGSFQDVHARKVAEEKLKRSLSEKEVLLMEIHHRVKNNLAVISSMMQLQAYDSDNDEVISHLTNSQSRIKSIALMHELLYETKSFSQINFKENITELVAHIANSIQSKTDVQVEFNLDPVELNINQAIPCSLILNELLTNSYKHAFNDHDKGKLEISLKENGKHVQLMVADNGMGLPSEFTLENPSSVGLKIMSVLTQQLQGELTYDSNNSQTTFTLTFEKKKTKGSASSLIE